MIIIYAGLIGRSGTGGAAWVDMQYLAGLRALGHDVFYLEDCGEWSSVYNWETGQMTAELTYPAGFVRSCLEPLDFQDRWIYRAGDSSEGMALNHFLDVCSEASLLIMLAVPMWLWRAEYDRPRRRILIDVDPGFTQIGAAKGDQRLTTGLARCDHLFTIAQRIGAADCPIPTGGWEWLKTVPPVSLPHWPVVQGAASHFTSVMSWRGFRDETYNGEFYGQKDKEFPKFLDLPRLTSQPFRVALIGADPKQLTSHGWEVVPGEIVTRTPATYQTFIHDARAEFGVAKHGYVKMRGGWFSDRSVCYLASGKPVLLQDTGLSDWLPTGEGILTFRDVPEALNGIEAINLDYERHCRAARQLAEQYFAAERVLPPLLDAAMS